MNRFWRLSIWISRAALAYAILDFGVPAFVALPAPVTMAWNEGIGMWSSTAISATRVHFGIYPVAVVCAAIR